MGVHSPSEAHDGGVGQLPEIRAGQPAGGVAIVAQGLGIHHRGSTRCHRLGVGLGTRPPWAAAPQPPALGRAQLGDDQHVPRRLSHLLAQDVAAGSGAQ
jgi:hypothetical protein